MMWSLASYSLRKNWVLAPVNVRSVMHGCVQMMCQ